MYCFGAIFKFRAKSLLADSNFLDFSCQTSRGYGRGDDELKSGRYLDSGQTPNDGTALIQTVRNLAFIFAQTIFGVILEHSNYQVMFSLAALTLSVALVLLIFYKIPKRPKENIFS